MLKLNVYPFKDQESLKQLNTVSLRLLPVLAANTDLDHKITLSENEIKKLGFMTPKLVKETINRLLVTGWIRNEKDGYYTTYTREVDENQKGYHFVNLYKIFLEDTFKGMYQRQIRMFLYFLTAKIPGQRHDIKIERCYRNNINKDRLIFDYFTSFQDFVQNFSALIEKGLLEVKLGKQSQYLNKDTKNIRDRLYAYCGRAEGRSRKRRIRHREDEHVIHVRVAPEVIKNVIGPYNNKYRPIYKDLEKIAEEYCCSLDFITDQELKPIYMLKQKLYKKFGSVGIKLYRDSLKDYFKTNSYSFEKNVKDGTFADIINNYYVLPRIEGHIREMLYKIKQEVLNKSYEQLTHTNLSVKQIYYIRKTEPFIEYYTNEVYIDNLVTFDWYIQEKFSVIYEQMINISNPWFNFYEKGKEIYETANNLGFKKKGEIYGLALRGKLSQLLKKERREYLDYNWIEL